MATTYTRNLRLRVADNLSADAKANLEILDALGGTLLLDSTDSVTLRATGDITLEPESTDIGGSGVGGTVSIGTSTHSVSLQLYTSTLNIHGVAGLLDQATSGAYYLRLKYNSTLTGSVEALADRTLAIDLGAADRSLILGADFSVTGAGALAFITQAATTWTLPSGYGIANQLLSTDGAGNLAWLSAGSGTVTSVALSAPSEFSVAGSPITTAGTLAITKATQLANTTWAGPTSGGAAQPTFRSLVIADIPSGVDHGGLAGLGDDDHTQYHTDARALTWLGTRSTSDLAEGTNLYYTATRFNTAFSAKSTTDLTEGTNLYYTAARFDTAFAAKSTTNLTEGSNLYFTAGRAQTAVVTQVITNGVTATSPSEDAVFDALALKANTALSNLASVAVNTALLPSTNNSVAIGSSSFTWSALHSHADTIYGSTSGAVTLLAADTTTPYSVKWPSAQGGANTNLKNDGSGNLSWGAGIESFTDTWTTGTSKTVTHNLSTRDVQVYIYELDSPFAMIKVDAVEHTSTSVVTLTSSVAPTGSGRKVLVLKIA